jgi:ATP adenylyltransferase/5',5'''-P-1,P-4-tetraphosphate phosphorylase II
MLYLQKILGSNLVIAPATPISNEVPVHTTAALPIIPRGAKKYDAIVYGATGFTGRLLARYFANTYGIGKSLKWAIGGRSRAKLQDIKNELIEIDPAMKE